MALGVARVVRAEGPVVGAGVDGDLVVQRAAADIVDLVDDVPGGVVGALAVGGVGSKSVDDASLDGVPLEEVRREVPGAAKAESLLGAVLQIEISALYKAQDSS